jgi:hypothetical protein
MTSLPHRLAENHSTSEAIFQGINHYKKPGTNYYELF